MKVPSQIKAYPSGNVTKMKNITIMCNRESIEYVLKEIVIVTNILVNFQISSMRFKKDNLRLT